MKPSLIKKLFQPYLDKPLSSEEEAIISDWEKENSEMIRNLPPEGKLPMDEVEYRMRENIRSGMKSPFFRKLYPTGFFIRAAAVLLLAVSFSLLLLVKPGSGGYQLVEAPSGEKVFIVLPDGSQVWLNAGSKMKYAKDFQVREVFLLNGEAYFDVKHLENRPFVVRHEAVYVKVLGTAFNVRAYKGNETRVTVDRGRVEVGEKQTKYTILTPNKEIVLNKNRPSYAAVRRVDAPKISAWKSDQVHLYDVSFEDIILSIENNYGVQVHYPLEMKDSISAFHYSTATHLTNVLSMLEMIYGIHYKITGKEVYLSKK